MKCSEMSVNSTPNIYVFTVLRLIAASMAYESVNAISGQVLIKRFTDCWNRYPSNISSALQHQLENLRLTLTVMLTLSVRLTLSEGYL
jgi:hypothetical protein